MANPLDWMKGIDDSTLLSQLTIPGTHESCALHGGVAYECQTLSITDQLNMGIRAFDIRCRHYQNKFPIHHAAIYQDLDFGDVQASCVAFMTAHPSETIIMEIKEEYNADENTESFETTFDEYVLPFQEYWFLGNRIPTLGETRGKIVLLRRFDTDDPDAILGINATGWVDNQTFALNNGGVGLIVQDQYTIADIGAKWGVVSDLINRAAADGSGKLLYVNFTSSAGLEPVTIAEGPLGDDGINAQLFSYLSGMPQLRHAGIIYLNFPESPDGLVPVICNLNQLFVIEKVPIPEHGPILKGPIL